MISIYELMEPYIFSAATRPGESDIFALTPEQLQSVADSLLAAAPPDDDAVTRVLEAAEALTDNLSSGMSLPRRDDVLQLIAAVSALRAREGQG